MKKYLAILLGVLFAASALTGCPTATDDDDDDSASGDDDSAM